MLIHPGQHKDVSTAVLRPKGMDRPDWLLAALLSCCGQSLPVGLQCSSHCDSNLAQLCCKKGTGVIAVHVEIVALVMKLLHQCEDYTGGLSKIFSVDQLCLTPIVDTSTLQVSRRALTQHIRLDAQWVWLTLLVLLERHDP